MPTTTTSLELLYDARDELTADEMAHHGTAAASALVHVAPARATSEVFAIVGRRGSGKSYAAGKLVEQLVQHGRQVIVVDVVGTWWGLRLGADGDPDGGLDIPVIGGDHGDIDVVAEGGAVVAQMLVDTGSSAVLDLSNLRKHARQRFLTDFAEEFFHLKKSARSSVHVVLEEAHTIIPQRVIKGQERMLGAFEDLVRLGRNYGIGISMIDQRPQSVHKDALNQAEVLLAFQLTGKHERDAVRGWAEHRELAGIKDAFSDLSSLRRGQCIAWSPQWLSFCGKVDVGPKETFDASATPDGEVDSKSGKQMRPIDLEALKQAMAEAASPVVDKKGRGVTKPEQVAPPGIYTSPRVLAEETGHDPAEVLKERNELLDETLSAHEQIVVLEKEVAALRETEKTLRHELDVVRSDLALVRDKWARALTQTGIIRDALDELGPILQIGELQTLGSTEVIDAPGNFAHGARAVHPNWSGWNKAEIAKEVAPWPIPVKQPERGAEPRAEFFDPKQGPPIMDVSSTPNPDRYVMSPANGRIIDNTALAKYLGGDPDPSLSTMQRRFLTVLYQRGPCTQAQVMMFANYGKNGHTTKAFNDLKEKGFVIVGNFGSGRDELALNGNGAKALGRLEQIDKPTLSTMERAFLVALAQRGALSQARVLTQTNYGKNGHTTAAFNRLRAIGVTAGAQDSDGIEITPWGREVLGDYEPIKVRRDFHRALISGAVGNLSQMERQFLAVIWIKGVDGATQAEVLKDAQYGKNGHTTAAFNRLVTMGYCKRTDKGIACSPDLFD